MRVLRRWVLITSVCTVLSATSVVSGWGAYAHWWVGRRVGLDQRVNLPDYWGRSWAAHWPVPYVEIIPLFPWTHGCMRTGLVNNTYPYTPTNYGQAQEIAELSMYGLVRKMDCEHQAVLNAVEMVETARGFLAHNRFDKHGHFTLFPGGPPAEAWAKHTLLEEYMDYRVLEKDNPEVLIGTVTTEQRIGSQGHGGIILLAQKCFRKNRHTIDAKPPHSGTCEAGPVEDLQQTVSQLQQQNASLLPLRFTTARYHAIIVSLTPLYGVGDVVATEQYLDTMWQGIDPSLETWAQDALNTLPQMAMPGPTGCLQESAGE